MLLLYFSRAVASIRSMKHPFSHTRNAQCARPLAIRRKWQRYLSIGAVTVVEARSLLKAHAAFRVTASPLPAQICVAGVSQVLVQFGAIASTVPVQMWQRRAQKTCHRFRNFRGRVEIPASLCRRSSDETVCRVAQPAPDRRPQIVWMAGQECRALGPALPSPARNQSESAAKATLLSVLVLSSRRSRARGDLPSFIEEDVARVLTHDVAVVHHERRPGAPLVRRSNLTIVVES